MNEGVAPRISESVVGTEKFAQLQDMQIFAATVLK